MSADSTAPDGSGSKSERKQTILSRLRRMFGGPSATEDIAAAIDNGAGGAVQNLLVARREMIERVVAFDEKNVVDVMTPRADIFAVDIDTSFKELIRIFTKAGHSRMPVYRGDLDDLGFQCDIGELVLSRAKRALEAGCDGVVASGLELPALRKALDRQIGRAHV